MTKHRLYFSHSYDPEDVPFNEHLWKLLMAAGFHTWIDTGREVVTAPNDGQPGARRPMDISFNEWMMSQCDGFVAIAPNRRKSEYQLLEYRIAVRMGVPRLVALQQGGTFDAPSSEIVELPTSWNQYWQDKNQSVIVKRIAAFAAFVEKQKAAGEVLRSVGHWRPRKNVGKLTVALLQPRANNQEWVDLQLLLQREDGIDWVLIPPANIQTEEKLLKEEFDLLVLDVGPRGTPQELLGYIHALGIPQIRLCRVGNEDEERVLGCFLDPKERKKDRSVYEQEPPDTPRLASVPRFLDGTKLDEKMQPVIFWMMPKQAADQILKTMQRISMFRSGLSPEKGGSAEAIDTYKNAKKYFDQQRAEDGFVFISFAGRGGASKLADRLAQILRFNNLRCFHYRDEDSHSDGRLESGEDVTTGLRIRINEADIVVYLIEEAFVKSRHCLSELDQGLELYDQGRIEFRPYRLETLRKFPKQKQIPSVHEFRAENWYKTDVEQKIVADIEESVKVIGWTLREKDRATLLNWLQESERNSIQGVLGLLGRMGVSRTELEAIAEAATGESWLDAVLRLPKVREKQKRARQIVALLLLAAADANPDRRTTAAEWLYRRRLLRWPMVDFDNEDFVEIHDGLIATEPTGPTIKVMSEIGQKVGQKHGDVLRGSRPVCVTAKTDFLAIPIEWACETQDDEPIAARRAVRWRLPDVDTRPVLFKSIASRAIPPMVLILALAGPKINPGEQARRLSGLLRDQYDDLGWPPEFVTDEGCQTAKDVLVRLRGCQHQVVHLAGHMGGAGLQVGDDLVDATTLAGALRESDVRLVVLNGCEGGKSRSSVAVDYLTLADRLIRDARVAEVVAHRGKISEADALAFAEAFYRSFYNSKDGFEPARAAFKARKAGSRELRYWPVVISQR